MPTTKDERLTRLTRNRQAVLEGEAVTSTTASQVQESPLDDPKIQEEILHPKYMEVSIGMNLIKLYPLSAMLARKFLGFAAQIYADAGASFGGKEQEFVKVCGILSEQYARRFAYYVAAATFEVPFSEDEGNSKRLELLQNDIYAKMQFNELGTLFGVLLALNSPKVATSPK